MYIIRRQKDKPPVMWLTPKVLWRFRLLLVAFPNAAIAVRIYLTIPINKCHGERSFSTLLRAKNHLRNTVSRGEIAALGLLCIGSDVLRQLD